MVTDIVFLGRRKELVVVCRTFLGFAVAGFGVMN